MEKSKKLKLFIGLSYLILLSVFLYLFFSKFSFQEITSYDFIKENRLYFLELRNSNLFLIFIIFLIVTILWVFPFLGFGTPIALMGGFIFGKWVGTLVVVLGLSIGATFLYIFGNYFLKQIVREKFLNKFQNLENKFRDSEFTYLLIYRFVGGIPWQLSCILPTIFDVKASNFFLATLIGIIPQIFLALTILWVFPFLGFGSPVALMGGFIFGKWIGTLVVVLGLSIGATFLYIFGNYFLKQLIREKFLNKFQNLEIKFKQSEFIYLLIYRFIGGIPWQLSCLLPTLFNVKVINFFFATLIGIIPQIFLAVSIGSGLEKIIDQNAEVPGITDIIFSPDIYVPISAFFILILITIFLRKFFYRN